MFDGFIALDLFGPSDAFSFAEFDEQTASDRRCYELVTIAESMTPVTTSSRVRIKPDVTFDDAPALDTLIIPGGTILAKPSVARPIAEFVKLRAESTRRIVSVCTGLYALAETGLLANRRVTTHWNFAKDIAKRFPELRVYDNAIYLKDGPFYTSAGVTAGIDLALFLIEEDFGRSVSLAIARDLVVYLKRSGGQEQYSEPLQFQSESVSRLSELTTWIVSHLHEDLSIEALAAKACLCPRHFTRRFKAEYGSSPGDFVEKLRLDEARRRLSNEDTTVESIGGSLGYKSSDSFCRAFTRRFGVTPSEYRQRFMTTKRASWTQPTSDLISLAPPRRNFGLRRTKKVGNHRQRDLQEAGRTSR
jgi:transcriptional regulator GlxA family with amidase domain